MMIYVCINLAKGWANMRGIASVVEGNIRKLFYGMLSISFMYSQYVFYSSNFSTYFL